MHSLPLVVGSLLYGLFAAFALHLAAADGVPASVSPVEVHILAGLAALSGCAVTAVGLDASFGASWASYRHPTLVLDSCMVGALLAASIHCALIVQRWW